MTCYSKNSVVDCRRALMNSVVSDQAETQLLIPDAVIQEASIH